MNFNILQKKWIPRSLFLGAIIILLIIGILYPSLFSYHSTLILIIITTFYVFFTLELVMLTRESRIIPYISPEFIMINKINENFLKKYGKFLGRSEKFNELYKEEQKGTLNKDIVFIKLENIGNTNAIDVILKISYHKKNLGDISLQTKELVFGTIKKGEYNIDLLEIYDAPSAEDYFQIEDCVVEFTDVNRKCAKEGATKEDFSKSAKVTSGKGISIIFK